MGGESGAVPGTAGAAVEWTGTAAATPSRGTADCRGAFFRGALLHARGFPRRVHHKRGFLRSVGDRWNNPPPISGAFFQFSASDACEKKELE